MFTISTRHVPAQRVMSIQRRLRAPETDPFIEEAKNAFRLVFGERVPTGPFIVIFYGIVDDESDGPIEAILSCPDDVRPTDLVGVRTEPEHDEAYTTITKAQWAYPAILAAYDAVSCSPEATARPGSRLSCRELVPPFITGREDSERHGCAGTTAEPDRERRPGRRLGLTSILGKAVPLWFWACLGQRGGKPKRRVRPFHQGMGMSCSGNPASISAGV